MELHIISNQSQYNQYLYVSTFHSKSLIRQNNFFWIQSTIIWYGLFFITFLIQLVPYIGWWRYAGNRIWYPISDIAFLNALFGHSLIVIFSPIPARLLSTKQRTLIQGKIIFRSTYQLSHDLLSWIYLNYLVNLLLVGILMNSADDILAWRTFRIRKSLCIPMRYPFILVSFPQKILMFLLWNSWDWI